ncbi:hypothetical protein GCM10011375_15390 [Hymenobacter qilianensis]|uniref:Uncharacterized protein n=2 Tax=Hymenobacter qilianensis TaxID=1385715 RepID=A0ACB5PQD6_9BACT|nr:hypothetical protein [Hymenobacter qilianensis]QNP52954.1 hypothetical protein H9L05_04450 [Hymenobacter qilianensis]GGF61178.1 hypothetical protein GCM10011375_15390 [Hymenobacter qilianensis]
MLAFKRLVNVVVMVYLLLALLFMLMPASRDFMMSSMGLSGDLGLATFYNTMFVIGAILLALELIVENLYNVALKRDLSRQEGKVNELKARLYDHQMEQRDRDLQARPVTTSAPANPARPVTTAPLVVPVTPVAPVVPPAPTPAPTATTATRLDPVYVVPADPAPGTNLPPNPNVVETPPHSNVPPASAADLETPRPSQYPSSQP